MLAEIKLGIIYAKFNTAMIVLEGIKEDGGFFARRFSKWLVIPMLKAFAKIPTKSVAGALRVVHRVLSIGDKQIENTISGIKSGFRFCHYHLTNWSRELTKYIF